MILRSLITVLALAGAAVAAATASDLSLTKPEASGQVASDKFAIYTSTLVSDRRSLIASDPTREINHAHLSPDRSHLAFTRYNAFNSNGVALEANGYFQTEIVVCAANGDNCQVAVPARAGIITAIARWTLDGRGLLYVTNDTPTHQRGVSLYDLVTGKITTPAPLTTTSVPPEFFGMTFLDNNNTPNAFAGQIGTLGKMPLTRWVYVQPTSSTSFNWARIDGQVAAMRKLGLTHFIYTINDAPGWAVANHATGTGKINTHTLEWESYLAPDNMADYTNFINALLTRYPEINILVPFNEPAYEPINIPAAIAMNRAAIDYVHSNFPGVKVASPTIQPMGTEQQNIQPGFWYYDYWNQGGPKDFDVLMWHGYLGTNSIIPNSLETFVLRRRHMQTLINLFGLQSKPVIDDESSWGLDTNVTANNVDTIAFVAQDLLIHWSFGDTVFVWYGGAGFGWGTLASNGGVVNPGGGVINPAGTSWLQTRSWMLGSTLSASGLILNGIVRSGNWSRPNGYHAISVWTTDGSSQTFIVPTIYPYVQYRDTGGNMTPITGGKVTITGRPIWIETKPIFPHL